MATGRHVRSLQTLRSAGEPAQRREQPDRQLWAYYQHALAGLLFVIAAWNLLHTEVLKHPPGQIAPREPIQIMLDNARAFTVGTATLQPRAKFQLEARVLSRERYWLGDRAKLMPIDIAFGWAQMSDTALLDKLSISQGMRFYYWQYAGPAPAAHEVIIRSSANMHLIPATPEVLETLLAARVGYVVRLEGDLVDVQGNGWESKTSLTRVDSGNGACETVYVRAVTIRPISRPPGR